MPRKVKHRKQQRGRTRGKAKGATTVAFGDYGIKALEPGWITARQIEAARIAMTRHIKRGGKVWINIFPDKPVTQKPAETRMGSGKGSPEHWVAVVKPGRVMFELAGVPEPLAREAAMAVGETSGQSRPRRVVSSAAAGRRRADGEPAEVVADEAAPLVKEADPELERLLAEEEEIERSVRDHSETPHFRPGDSD